MEIDWYMSYTSKLGIINWARAQQNKQNDLCTHQSLISALASTLSNQSSQFAWRKFGSLAKVHSED